MTSGHRPLLVVTDRRFWRRSIGSEQRVANLIEHLAARRGTRVVVAYLGRASSAERGALDAFRAGLPTLEIRSRPVAPTSRLIDAFADAFAAAGAGASAATRAALRRLGPGPSSIPSRDNPLLGPGSAARRRFVQSLLRELAPRIVLVEFLRLTPTVHPRSGEPGGPPPAYLVDTHDVLHERAARFRAHGAAPSLDVDAQQEAHALATYDAILAIQARDAATLTALVPARPVLTVPHGLALPRLEPMSAAMSATMSAAMPASIRPPMPASALAPGSRPLRLGFLGGRDASNRDGLRWFLDAVWPPLRGRFGATIELHVAGSLGEEAGRAGAGDGVVWVGPVASIDLFWPAVDVAINPIRFGTGLKIKNVEALAYRRALITTPVGAEGLEAAAPAGLAIAETPAEWIQVLSGWIHDPAALARTAEAGRLHAERCFAPAAAFRALDEHLDLLEARALMPTEARA